ncbi:MAG: sigma-70 family RNA polymerase sigma factor [Deltaproteobacteria bacterium]|nr:sigma-70 family RNA polymerase sigma factor [Deltaproteobacteria bacterium]
MSKALVLRAGELDTYVEQINRIPMLTREEERELAIKYFDYNDLKAAQKLVAANLRFVVKIAHEFTRYGAPLADLVQEGNMGLMLAVKRFNPHKGYRLISYAVWWIKAMIRSFVMKTWSMVKIGTTRAQRKLFFKLLPASRELDAGRDEPMEHGDKIAALAEKLGIKDKDIFEMELKMSARDFSLDAKMLKEDKSATYLDMLTDDNPSPEDKFATEEKNRIVKQHVDSALARLPERERMVVQRRVLSDEPPSLASLAKEMGISRERVRQIEASGLKKIKAYLSAGTAAKDLLAA